MEHRSSVRTCVFNSERCILGFKDIYQAPREVSECTVVLQRRVSYSTKACLPLIRHISCENGAIKTFHDAATSKNACKARDGSGEIRSSHKKERPASIVCGETYIFGRSRSDDSHQGDSNDISQTQTPEAESCRSDDHSQPDLPPRGYEHVTRNIRIDIERYGITQQRSESQVIEAEDLPLWITSNPVGIIQPLHSMARALVKPVALLSSNSRRTKMHISNLGYEATKPKKTANSHSGCPSARVVLPLKKQSTTPSKPGCRTVSFEDACLKRRASFLEYVQRFGPESSAFPGVAVPVKPSP